MSQVYSLEPPTNGKVVLRTTIGDLDVELWPKEAPRAVRNFVQLCMEGYYDGTPFHRILKDFMVQGGDPTGTGNGGESIYGRPFKDEFHSRLKFNHRGLIACANQNAPDTNGAQFFITLERADHLDRKATIFGKITGDTIYNLSKLNELETDDDDRPENPPLVLRADILLNPFDDIKPRISREQKEAATAAERLKKEQEKKNLRKGAKNFKLISFGDEAEEEDAVEVGVLGKIKSAHDALEDEKLSKQAAVEINIEKVREAMRIAKAPTTGPSAGDEGGEIKKSNIDADWAAELRNKVALRSKSSTLVSSKEEDVSRIIHDDEEQEDEEEDGGGEEIKNKNEERQQFPSKRPRLAGTGPGLKSSAAVVAPSRQLQVQDRELLTDWERRRQEYKERKRLGGNREKDTMSKLSSFMGKLANKPQNGAASSASAFAMKKSAAAAVDDDDELAIKTKKKRKGWEPATTTTAADVEKVDDKGNEDKSYSGHKVDDEIDHRAYMPAAWRFDTYLRGPTAQEGGGGGDDNEVDVDGGVDDDSLDALRGHRLEFKGVSKKDGNARTEGVDDYVVVDPLLEKGKAKFNKEQQRQKKRQNEWAGRSRD